MASHEIMLASISELRRQRDVLHAALEEIASYADGSEGYHGHDCTCGHKAMFCWKVQADRHCGGWTTPAIWKAREALEASEPRALDS